MVKHLNAWASAFKARKDSKKHGKTMPLKKQHLPPVIPRVAYNFPYRGPLNTPKFPGRQGAGACRTQIRKRAPLNACLAITKAGIYFSTGNFEL